MGEEQDTVKSGYIRVTEVLSPFSGLHKIDPTILQKAANRGTLVHSYCQMYLEGTLFFDPPQEVAPYLQSFISWADKMLTDVLSIEERFYSDELGITGQVDIIGCVNGDKEPSIIDIKTPASHSKTWPLQTAAYMLLAEKYQPKRRLVLQLMRDGSKAKVHEYTEHDRDLSLFDSALALYKHFA